MSTETASWIIFVATPSGSAGLSILERKSYEGGSNKIVYSRNIRPLDQVTSTRKFKNGSWIGIWLETRM